jgi:uncharacterized cofD-like protein
MNYSASDHVKALYNHMPCPFIDVVIVNDAEIPKEIQKKYEAEQARPVKYDASALQELGVKVLHDHIVEYDDGVIRHDTKKVSSLIFSLLPFRFKER